MAKPNAPEEWLLERIQRFTQHLAGISRRVRTFGAMISQRDFPGSFRSKRRYGRGIEPEIPRAYQMGDDACSIDLGRVDTAIAHCPAWAILNGALRVVQAPLDADSEFVAIIDLSRSMLSECFGGDLDQAGGPPQKLVSLFGGVTVFLSLAESAGFPIRVLSVQGRNFFESRCRAPRDFAQHVLSHMTQVLTRNFAASLGDPLSVEPFSLRRSCAAAVPVPAPAVVTVFSDFLDPFEGAVSAEDKGYADPLKQLMARHQAILVDLSSDEDNSLPKPGRFDFEARRLPCVVGARRIELGMEPRYLTKSRVELWNSQRNEEHRRLLQSVKLGHGQFLRMYKQDFVSCYHLAVRAMLRMR